MKQKPSEIVGARERAARKRLFSLPGHHSMARRTEFEDDTELAENLRNQMDKAEVNLEGGTEDSMLCARRVKAIKNIAYSGWKGTGRVERLKKKDLYFGWHCRRRR